MADIYIIIASIPGFVPSAASLFDELRGKCMNVRMPICVLSMAMAAAVAHADGVINYAGFQNTVNGKLQTIATVTQFRMNDDGTMKDFKLDFSDGSFIVPCVNPESAAS